MYITLIKQKCILVGCVLPAAGAAPPEAEIPEPGTLAPEQTPREQTSPRSGTPWRPAARHTGIPPAMHAGTAPPCEQNS